MSQGASGQSRTTIAIIGAGQIGGAAARVLAESGRWDVIAADREEEALRKMKPFGIRTKQSNEEAVGEAEMVILAVKPRMATAVISQIAQSLQGKLVISFAAAINMDVLKSAAPEAVFVRAMPNIALMAKESYTGYSLPEGISDDMRVKAEMVLGEFGEAVRVDEYLLDAITGLSGSGPAYAAIFIEALAYAGLKVGLPREIAMRSAARTLLGTAMLVLNMDIHPSLVKEMVVTPGGTTIQGIYHIEESGIRSSVMRAVDAATSRCTEITDALNSTYNKTVKN